MSRKRKFKTRHGLKFQTVGGSPFKTFDTFAMGGVAGFYRCGELTIDFMIGGVSNGEHMIDVVEWFAEMAREMRITGVRVLSCTDAELMRVFVDYHDFRNLQPGVLYKQILK